MPCRLYAVGFAFRQLTGTSSTSSSGSNPPCQPDSTQTLRDVLLQSVQQARSDLITRSANVGPVTHRAAAAGSSRAIAALERVQTAVKLHQQRFLQQDVCAVAAASTDSEYLGSFSTDKERAQQIMLQQSSEVATVKHYLSLGHSEYAAAATKRMKACIKQHPLASAAAAAVTSANSNSADASKQGQGQLTDVQSLSLLPPVPVDALVDPAVWWGWHADIMGLKESCDACGEALKPPEYVVSTLPAVACAEILGLIYVQKLSKNVMACTFCHPKPNIACSIHLCGKTLQHSAVEAGLI